ncbi:VOC family protein [Paenibacillus mucilaginosus]|uniref:VOC domain-containing protein n=2 Tax=Paenibacillus mucilaginosus TaxID=61624 RepID=H6NH06_9BACL|nr:glyoxalase/bleomycin resistance/dioxygenase family protein [Paenibacillus mucilaginosus]AEI39717.1 hypothetical protein KNP414_01150 [Paenibacillus mucilaginosus KNP414]AFC28448.1 hypothetical protein PM3016_1523 [Paenibacillus mucilaginosus 3016]MCG7218160.1 glyoxalase/bleomycin resistance/dioxygenase family protein [Paenibacillus mucilaginosus]WDM29009.1 glyoxalase/bleomycin resistance/dioxygenase family protein [Paenibacillus mucilaginosus]WFA17245.1 glyoxalase/bleomycin resistance/dioxy
MKVLDTMIRVYIEPDQLESTINFYEALYQERCKARVRYEDLHLDLAMVSQVLIMAGDANIRKELEIASATIVVDSIQEARDFLQQQGAVCLTEPQQTPGSWIMFVKHPDGLVAEYVQPFPHDPV